MEVSSDSLSGIGVGNDRSKFKREVGRLAGAETRDGSSDPATWLAQRCNRSWVEMLLMAAADAPAGNSESRLGELTGDTLVPRQMLIKLTRNNSASAGTCCTKQLGDKIGSRRGFSDSLCWVAPISRLRFCRIWDVLEAGITSRDSSTALGTKALATLESSTPSAHATSTSAGASGSTIERNRSRCFCSVEKKEFKNSMQCKSCLDSGGEVSWGSRVAYFFFKIGVKADLDEERAGEGEKDAEEEAEEVEEGEEDKEEDEEEGEEEKESRFDDS